MKKQYQHIVPQVYLKEFGFQRQGIKNRWFVSVNRNNKQGWEYRDIKRFLGEYNLYDIESNETIPVRILENGLHGKVESRIPKIIDYLENNVKIHTALFLDIVETTSNFLCRSSTCLEWITNIVKQKPAEFWKLISDQSPLFKDDDQRHKVFGSLMNLPEKDRRNNFMLFYMHFIYHIVKGMNLVVFRNEDNHFLFTSDHPVQILDAGYGELLNRKCQIFFPLTPNYLIYFFWNKNDFHITEDLPLLSTHTIQPLSRKLYDYFCKDIVTRLVEEYIIAPIDTNLLDEEEE